MANKNAERSTPSKYLVETRGLSRTYQSHGAEVVAVKSLDLALSPGEIVGFLGPNGAGKTTTLRMLATLLRPSAGQASVAGHDLMTQAEAVRRKIGYVPQSGCTDPEAQAGEELVDQAQLYGIDAKTAEQRARSLLQQLDLPDIWSRRCDSLSGGQRRRLDIVMGLIHQPTLVFLDEPTTGLDPQARANLWDHIRRVRDEFGATIFLTTHYMDEANALCDRILIIDHGEIVAEGSPGQLKQRVSGDVISLSVESEAVSAQVTQLCTAQFPGVSVSTAGTRVAIQVPPEQSLLFPLVRALTDAGIAARDVKVQHPTLDDVFLKLTGRSLRDAA